MHEILNKLLLELISKHSFGAMAKNLMHKKNKKKKKLKIKKNFKVSGSKKYIIF
jgi:hypothetical protein